jgi:hypothetical protein
LRKRQEKREAEEDYRRQLADPYGKQKFFAQLANIREDDHKYIKTVKKKINKLIKQELEYLGFMNLLKEEDQKALESDVYHEVKTKSNYYFSVDENKVDKNLKLYNKKAPGVVYHKPSVILEHEHIHIQHYIDAKRLRGEKLFEIYAYYNYLIDLHIS